jgi:hypothetical protein
MISTKIAGNPQAISDVIFSSFDQKYTCGFDILSSLHILDTQGWSIYNRHKRSDMCMTNMYLLKQPQIKIYQSC